MNNELLPIGTVCTLKGGEKKLMITAFMMAHESSDNGIEEFDYCGCLYPEGMVDSSEHYLFNKEDIEVIHYMGFINDEEKEFKNALNELINKNVNNSNKSIETLKSNEIIDEIVDIPILSQQLNVSNNSNIEIETL